MTSQYSGASFYTVSFPVNVTGCAYTAIIGGASTSYAGFGEISVYSANALPNSVTVVYAQRGWDVARQALPHHGRLLAVDRLLFRSKVRFQLALPPARMPGEEPIA